MPATRSVRARAEAFCRQYGLGAPILLAPMAGSSPPGLSVAVANAGGFGACGGLLMQPAAIKAWAADFRAGSNAGFQLNLWIPDPPPARNPVAEDRVRLFLGRFGPLPSLESANPRLPDFAAQCEAMLEAGPAVVSSIMGLYPPDYVARLKARGIKWFANTTTVTEALAAEAAGADAIIAQGMEAGGHRGAFDAAEAEKRMVGLFALLPAVADAVRVPVIATGGIADGRGIAAALTLGASAVQIGTGFLRTPEAKLPAAWSEALGRARPEDTLVTRAFSGRAGRGLATKYALAAGASDAPPPAPYPVQRGLTQAMREAATAANVIDTMQAWSGQSAGLAPALPAADLFRKLWDDARALLA